MWSRYLQDGLDDGDGLAGAGRAVQQVGRGARAARHDALHGAALLQVALHQHVEEAGAGKQTNKRNVVQNDFYFVKITTPAVRNFTLRRGRFYKLSNQIHKYTQT